MKLTDKERLDKNSKISAIKKRKYGMSFFYGLQVLYCQNPI